MKYKERLQNERIQARMKADMRKKGIELTHDDDYIRLVPIPQTFQYKDPDYFEDETSLETTFADQESIH